MRTNAVQGLIAIFVFVIVVGMLVGGSMLLGGLPGLVTPTDDTEPYVHDTEDLYIDRLEASGEVTVEPADEPGRVLIDDAHDNGYEHEDIRELTGALTRAGHDVRTLRTSTLLEEELEEADAFVVVDPRTPYGNETGDAVEAFVEDGGQLIILGQPNRGEVGDFQVEPRRSEADSLASRFGITFGTDHVYDMEANDGNHRNVVTNATDHPLVEDVDHAVFYTATHVQAADGDPLVTTQPSAQRAGGGGSGEYPIATISDGILAIGDVDFLAGESHVVADNDAFIEAMVAFLSDIGS